MKNLLSVITIALVLAACNSKSTGKKFSPKKIVMTPALIIRQSSLKSGRKEN